MPYTNVWSTANPTGLEAANTIDNIIRAFKLDIQERLMDMFDMPNFTDDPLVPYNINLSSGAGATGNKIIVGASGGLLIRNAADSATNLSIADTGTVTVNRGTLAVSTLGADVTQTAGGSAVISARATHATYTGALINSVATRAASANYQHIYCTSNGAIVFYVDGTGRTLIGGALANNVGNGELSLGNTKAIRGTNAAGTDTIRLIELSSSDAIRIAAGGNIVTLGSTATLNSAVTGDAVIGYGNSIRSVNFAGTDTEILIGQTTIGAVPDVVVVGAGNIISLGGGNVCIGAAPGEIVLGNNAAIRGANAASTASLEIIKLNASDFVEVSQPLNITGSAGFGIGSISGRRRLSTTGPENFELVGDSNSLCTLDVQDVRTFSGYLARSRVGTPYGNGAASSAATLTNAPVAGNPTKWIPIVDNATTRYIPAW